MKIICNGETREINQNTTLVSFIEELDLNPDTVVAECDCSGGMRRQDYQKGRV